ncbi:unnamed protein product [Arabidopsis thaliana]|nr:hypothetical protein [Arabidopsis thaliana]BAB08828.1 unnamed protein product [Arabidopsis thaliana]
MKRSLGSNSSNNSGSGSNKKSKKNNNPSNQKTLGAAWGAASSRSSFRSSPFSDFGSYMEVKNRKLQNQFETEASAASRGVSGSEKLIFQGVSIFVDGFTIPSHQDIQQRITCCETYMDSGLYLCQQTSGLSHLTPQMASPVTSFQPDTGYSEAEEGSSIRADDSEEARDHIDDEIDGVYIENTTPELTEQTGTGDLKSSEMNAEGLGNYDIEEKEVSSELQSTTNLHSTSDNKSVHANGKNGGKSIATAAGSSTRRHSTLEDPNFVENYFKNSRLHFIGTWRNRYRKRFHGSSNGLKWADSGQNTAEMAKKSTIIHIDLLFESVKYFQDCFFVSVVIKNRLELHDKPVAVCHSDNPKGTAEISSANYPARAYGVKAGMFVRHAKDLCPQLVIVPYNFEAYEEALSCDEAFLDVSDLSDVETEVLASTIRNEILETTGCSASAGIGGTMLMARLATRVAKPAGQLYISAEKVEEFLDQLPVGTLPGVGSVLKEKLVKQNIQTCGQLRLISKIKKRKKDAEEPTKYMGCGDCDNLSRSITVPAATDDIEVLQRISKKLFGSFCLDVKEVRGVGLQVSKLDSADPSNKGSRTLKSWLSSAPAVVQIEQDDNVFAAKVRENSDCNRPVTGGVSRLRESNSEESSIQSGDTNSSLPPMCYLDMEVLENLPPELLSELDGTYGGKLFELIEKKRGKRRINCNSPHVSLDGTAASIKELKSLSVKIHGLSTSGEKEYKEPYVPHPSIARTSNQHTIEMTDLLPSSLSQVDVSVLQELPEELRADVLGAFPSHRRQQSSSDVPKETCKKQDEEPIDLKGTENEIGLSFSSLWFGNPPLWTEKFKVSGNCTMEKLSAIYFKVAQSRPMLSLVLQHAISEMSSFPDAASASDLDKAIYDVCELLKQYINLKIITTFGDDYTFTSRLAARSQLFLQVYEILSPFIQDNVDSEGHHGERTRTIHEAA